MSNLSSRTESRRTGDVRAHEIRGRRLAQRLEDVRHDNGLVRLPEVDRFISREFEGSGSATRSRSRSTLKRFWMRREINGETSGQTCGNCVDRYCVWQSVRVLVLAGKYILFRFVPHRMVAGILNVKTVIVNQRAAVGGAKGDEHRRQNR